MELQWIGLVSAVATFVGIWFGHVAVRVVEASVGKLWKPIVFTLVLGLGLEYWSLVSGSRIVSAAIGILGVTLLWDSFEFWRQQKRIIKGHAPANPDNPRHARIMRESQDSTTLDLLNRNPVGRIVSKEEAIQLVKEQGA